jgi:autotransporter-associated beta strand protein
VTLSNPATAAATTGSSFTFSGGGGLGAAAGTHSVAAGATLQIGNGGTTGSLVTGQAISVNGALAFNHSNAFAYAEVISGLGTVTQAGGSTLTLGGTGSNTYTGATVVSSGTLVAGRVTSAFGNNSAVTVANGAGLRLNAFSNTVGSLAGAGTVENANATGATLTIGGDNTSTNFSGALQDGVGGGKLSIT